MILPTGPVLDAFASVVSPLLEDADNLLAHAESTVGLRDLLLPKLVTGQIDLSTLDLGGLLEDTVA